MFTFKSSGTYLFLRHFTLLLLLCVSITTFPENSLATDKDVQDGTVPDLINEPEAEATIFEYILEGRPDPFLPFIEPKVATTLDPNEIIESDINLTGMQLFEPGQLTLVGIMVAGGEKIAMVEDVTGKGYVVNKGMLIGRNGVVSDITQDNDVIITETAQTRSGKEIVTTVVMRLNKEGDL